MKTLTSVIIPFKNRFDVLERAIDSVLSQTFQNFEIVLIDDGSDVYFDYKKYNDSRIKYIRNPKNIGPGYSRNYGLANASGSYIAFLDSDDFWKPKFLEKTIERLVEKPHLPFVYTFATKVDENGAFLGRRKAGNERTHQILPYIFENGRPWGTSSVLWNKNILEKVGGLPEGYIYEDYLLDVKVAKETNYIEYIPEELTILDAGNEGKISLELNKQKLIYKLESLTNIIDEIKDSPFANQMSLKHQLYGRVLSCISQILDRKNETGRFNAQVDAAIMRINDLHMAFTGEVSAMKLAYKFLPDFASRYFRYRKRNSGIRTNQPLPPPKVEWAI